MAHTEFSHFTMERTSQFLGECIKRLLNRKECQAASYSDWRL